MRLALAVGRGEGLDGGLEGGGVAQQRGDVFEEDAGLREVGYVADVGGEVGGH